MVEMKPGETVCCPHCGVTVQLLHQVVREYGGPREHAFGVATGVGGPGLASGPREHPFDAIYLEGSNPAVPGATALRAVSSVRYPALLAEQWHVWRLTRRPDGP